MNQDIHLTTCGFDAFARGTFGNAGQNLYVSRSGVLQRIFQFDVNRNGYVDLVFCNSQNHYERSPTYVYRDPLTDPSDRIELPAEGARSGAVADLTGDGYEDLIIGNNYGGVTYQQNCSIYFGSSEGLSERYRQELAAWDAVYDRDDRAAAIFGHLRRILSEGGFGQRAAPTDVDPEAALGTALERLREQQGDDPAQWRWGRTNRSEFPHSLVSAYDLPAAERLGGAGTVAAVGATFREIIDFSDLDGSLATNAPGQSGRPGSPFYGNLVQNWADQEYFPMSFSREAVEANAAYRLTLVPGG